MITWILLAFQLLLSPLISPGITFAAENCEQITCNKDTQSSDDYLSCNKNKQSCWESRIKETQSAAITLNNTISLLNGRISLQALQIEQTMAEISTLELQINDLSNRITGLNLSLDRLSTVLVKRVQEKYKTGRTNANILVFAADSFNEFVNQHKYLELTQQQTADAMARAETQRVTYDEQRALKEQKQDEIETKRTQLQSQQSQVTKQRGEQQYLLSETKNNEAMFQRELEKTLAELEAIQSIIAGLGTESKVRDVAEGDQIASIIVGASPCSTGTHLHFEVVKDGVNRDPATYLKSADVTWNNSPDGAFGFGGDWTWPLNDPAKINQGYGMTYYARVKRSYGGAPHTGIDMSSKQAGNYGVRAVKGGSLYRGSIKCGGGLLKYVKVEHSEGGFSSYYLHVNY
ncbi:MAG: hypothetical protein M3Q81_01615 [bacterium]|nr:hypothetical protein [bacterium]